jgi:hypothetical protein
MMRWRAQDEHTAQAKAERERYLQDRGKLQKLKAQVQAESAGRALKVRQVHMEEKGKEERDRQVKATSFIQHQRELAIRKRDEKTKMDFQRDAILSEFREQLRRGGQLNVDELAKKYGIDIEELRRRVEEAGKRGKSEQTEQPEEGRDAQLQSGLEAQPGMDAQ